MKQKIYTALFFLVIISFSSLSYAQVGVYTNTPESSSILDIHGQGDAQGLLIPSMTAIEKNAILKPAHSLLVYDTDKQCISQNIGTETVPEWTCLTLYNKHFFYMPSINIETSDSQGKLLTGTQTLDLYGQYLSNFETPAKPSVGAPAEIPFFSASELNYYITYCDGCITIDSISDTGVMTYTVNYYPNYDAYINIVFVLK